MIDKIRIYLAPIPSYDAQPLPPPTAYNYLFIGGFPCTRPRISHCAEGPQRRGSTRQRIHETEDLTTRPRVH